MSEALESRRRPWLALVPITAFLLIAALFYRGLSGNPSEIPSALIDKSVPQFELPAVEGLGSPGFTSSDLATGGITLVNVWGSWCVPCRSEHPLLVELAKRPDIRVFGINYKDEPENARRFLGSLGNPFAAVGADRTGRVAIDWGVYGVPETFIVDGAGVIRLKWIGELTADAIRSTIAPKIAELGRPQVRRDAGS
jgi:cytochrome c biogenesis protein CcmG/thiol:disulfide interchange protein DsbE